MQQTNTYDLLAPIDRWTTTNTGLKVDSRLMKSYGIQTTMDGLQLATVQNAKGEIEIFSLDYNGNVNNYYPDSTSDTGWSKAYIGLNLGSVFGSKIAAGKTAEGNLIVFAATSNTFSFVLENPTSESRWAAPQHLPIDNSMMTNIACKNINGQLYLGIAKSHSNNTATFYYGCWDSANPSLGTTSKAIPRNNFPKIGWTAGASSGGIQLLVCMNGGIVGIQTESETDAEALITYAEPKTDLSIPSNPSLVSLSVIDDADGNTIMFGIFDDKNLYFLNSKGQKNGFWKWNQQLSSGVQLMQVQGNINYSGQLEVFALSGSNDSTNQLYHIRQDSESPNGWTEFVNLGFEATSISTARNAGGYSQLYGTTYRGAISHIWQNPDTTDWESFLMQTEENGEMVDFISYSAEITVVDADGLPSPNQDVKIWSPDRLILTINGESFRVGANKPAVCQTNYAGQVTISSKTETLSAPLLKVWTGLMEPNDCVVIEPNIDIQDRLRVLTDKELLNAKDSEGVDLVQGVNRNPETVDHITNAITQSMTLVSPTIGTNKNNLNRLRERTSRKHLTYMSLNDPNFSHKIDLSAVPDQHWKMDFSTGEPIFTSMTREEAEISIAETIALQEGGFLRIDWGDVWQSIKAGVNKLVSFTVSTVKEGISVVVSFGKYVWEGIISFVEQAFDLIEGIFKQIKVSFQRLFEWLGFLLDWKDILRAKEAIKHIVNQGFGVMQSSLQFVKVESNSYFTALKDQIDASFNQMIQSQLGKESLLFANQAPATPGVERSSSHNVVNSAYLNNLSNSGGISADSLENLAADALSPLDTLINNLEKSSETFQKAENFQNALNYFQQAVSQIKTNPQQALHTTFAGFLEVLSGLAQLAVTLVQGIVDSLLSALSSLLALFQSFLNDPWNIPFVSNLYNYVTGGTLSALDLTALIFAIPTTIFYKVTQNDWVFPNQQSVDNFKTVFTSEAIIAAMGINSPEVSPQMNEDNPPKQNKLALALAGNPIKFIGMINLFGYFSYGVTTGVADAIPSSSFQAKPSATENAISVGAIVSEITIWITGCPYLSDVNLVNRPKIGTPSETAALAWVFGLFGWATDLGVFLSYYKANDNNVKGRRGKKSSLSGDIGVFIAYIPVVLNIAIYSVLVSKQKSAGKYDAMTTAANFLSVTPGVFGFLRFSPISKSPHGQLILVGLAALDILCNITAGVLNFVLITKPNDQKQVSQVTV